MPPSLHYFGRAVGFARSVNHTKTALATVRTSAVAAAPIAVPVPSVRYPRRAAPGIATAQTAASFALGLRLDRIDTRSVV